ncbi:glycosyltransferase family 2 protein [Aeromonas media]|uniref:glycosyltransferase family 2 protein n=1 Tax=Aeromonas media TaxID=651 RepID=UPI003D2403EF
MFSLSIAISTFGDRIRFLESYNFDSRVEYLILWQKPTDFTFLLPSNVKLFRLGSVGVTKSRNMAIELFETEWLWFMDDDVSIPKNTIGAVLLAIKRSTADRVIISSVFDEYKTPIKIYDKSHSNILTDIINVGTIQIIINKNVVKDSTIRFPIYMGAGSNYPACDEPVFLSRLFKAKLISGFEFDNNIVVHHPRISSGLFLNKKGCLISRAILFKEMFGFPICIGASIYFFAKNMSRVKLKFIYLFFFWHNGG